MRRVRQAEMQICISVGGVGLKPIKVKNDSEND
jgi:hypothetical protein